MRRVGRPHWALVAVTATTLIPLAVTAPASPARALTGAFVTLTFVQVMQVLVLAFFGHRAAFLAGVLVAVLTVGLVAGPPPSIAAPEVHWRTPLSGADVVAVALLAPPRHSAGAEALERGGRAVLYVCIGAGRPSDVRVQVSGVVLAQEKVSDAGQCWQTFDVPAAVVQAAAGPLEATISGTAGASVELVGSYSRRRTGENAPGGAALISDGRRVTTRPSSGVPGMMVDRFFVEARIFAQDGRLVEIWF